VAIRFMFYPLSFRSPHDEHGAALSWMTGVGRSHVPRLLVRGDASSPHWSHREAPRETSWTHFIDLIPLKDRLQRQFYAEMCRVEGWSVRALREKIDGMLYERTARSKKPADVIRC
jgi:hypothetical protein